MGCAYLDIIIENILRLRGSRIKVAGQHHEIDAIIEVGSDGPIPWNAIRNIRIFGNFNSIDPHFKNPVALVKIVKADVDFDRIPPSGFCDERIGVAVSGSIGT